jgi:hypothetical protein
LAVSRQVSDLGKIDQERLRSDVIGTPAEALLTDILLESDDVELDNPLEDLLSSVQRRRSFEQQLRMRTLAQKFQEGAIKRGSEEFEEYWRLVKSSSSPWRR